MTSSRSLALPGGAVRKHAGRFTTSIRGGWSGPLIAATTLLLAFHAGGFFPGIVGVVAAGLVLVLVVRIAVAERPFEGWTWWLNVAAGAFALFAAWTLLSATWS